MGAARGVDPFAESEDQSALRLLARETAQREVAPDSRSRDESGEAPLTVAKALAAADLLRVTVPEEYGGLGYGDVKKDLLRRLLAYFGPMRERRADLEKRPDDVEAVLLDGPRRAREIGAPILDEVRQAAGFRPRN